MAHVVSATEARIHFGELMRKAQHEIIIVERDGKAEVVILSMTAFDELKSATPFSSWRGILQEAHQRIREESSGRPIPAPEEILYQIREEHDEESSLRD